MTGTMLRLLTDKQMARRLRVTREWLRAEVEAGRLPAVKAGDVFLFDAKVVEDLLLARARQAPTAQEGQT
jgi:excisionase family DNA binding protein